MADMTSFLQYLRLQEAAKKGIPADIAGETPMPAPKPIATTQAPVEIPETNAAAPEIKPLEQPGAEAPSNSASTSDGLLSQILAKQNQKPLTQVDLTPKAEMHSSEPELLAAQEASEKERNLARLMGSADIAARAIGGADQSTQAQAMFKGLESDAEIPLKNFQQKLAIRDKDIEAQSDDPKSEVSQMYRLALAKAIPGINFTELENLSANQIGKILPSMKSVMDSGGGANELMAVLRAQQAETRLQQGDRKLDQADTRSGNLEKNRERTWKEKDELSDKQNEVITNMDNTLGMMDELEELKPAFDTGPIAGRVAKWRQRLGEDDAQISAFKAKIGRNLANYVKGMSGTAVSDPEYARLLTYVPSELDSDETFLAKVSDMKREAERSRSRTLEGFRRQGKNPDNYVSKNKGIDASISSSPSQSSSAAAPAAPATQAASKLMANEVKRQTRDGKTAIFDKDTKQFLRYE